MSSRIHRRPITFVLAAALVAGLTLAATGCGDKGDGQGASPAGRSGREGMMGAGMGRSGGGESAAVPVQVQPVVRRSVSRFLETNGVLEAENEIDLVARLAGPVVEILTEEGLAVRSGQLLARIDDREARNQVALGTVSRDEARLAFERAQSSYEQSLIAREAYDAAVAKLESAEAQLAVAQLQFDYTRITAPFDALVVTRYVKLAQHVSNGSPLFRLSDFVPLLCPIQVPEKELPNVHIGQGAKLELDAFAGRTFSAKVLRISPTVEASSGTLKVTLEVDGRGLLRPGLFANVKLETARHENALVVPKTALVMDSIGDTVYVRSGDFANRREVKLGFREADRVEVLDGLTEGEEVIVLGQEGLSDGTPVTVLATVAPAPDTMTATMPAGEHREVRRDAPQLMPAAPNAPVVTVPTSPVAQQPPPAAGAPRSPGGFQGGAGMGGGMPPQFVERIRNATPEELEKIKDRMRQRGMTDQQIDEMLRSIRSDVSQPTPAAR